MFARRRGRLRFRVMTTFAAIAVLVVSFVSVATYVLTSRYLLSQRETSADRQTQANGRLVRNLLRSSDPDVPRLLASVGTAESGRSLVRYHGAWFATSAGLGAEILPVGLRELVVDERRPGRQRYHTEQEQVVAVGLPLGDGNAYFEIFALDELSRTLNTIRFSLLAAAGLAFAASLSLGYWASGRVLRPVGDIGRTAASIAAGRLDARLDVGGDDELFELANGFNAMVESLKDRIERDARFASDVSHELRSPLTTLRSAVEIMQARRSELPARSARALDLLTEEVDRFEGLVTDLLEISRYDAGVAVLDLEPVDVGDLIRRVLANEDCAHVPVVDELPSDARLQLVDRRRLEQSLANLVRNAASYAGGVTSAGVYLGADSVVVHVDDVGPGVPAEDREAIFQRFFRGTTAGRRSSTDGVGLGLALVHEQVRLHGGQVWVEDVAPHGARFVLQLPRRAS